MRNAEKVSKVLRVVEGTPQCDTFTATHHGGNPPLSLVPTGADVIDNYLEHLYALGLAERTIRVYRRAVERWLVYAGSEKVCPVGPSALELAMYAQGIPQTATSRRQHRVALRHWFDAHGVTAPVEAIRVPPKKRGVSRALEPDEAARLAVAAAGWHPEGSAVLLGLYLGLRRDEIAKAQWARFDRDMAWYTVLGKRDVEATLPVHQVLRDELADRMTLFPYVFPGRSSAHVSAGTINQWVGKVGDKAGVSGLSPHRLRHTAIATINDNTGDLRAAQEFARHADPNTTRIYTRVNTDRLKRAVEALRYVA